MRTESETAFSRSVSYTRDPETSTAPETVKASGSDDDAPEMKGYRPISPTPKGSSTPPPPKARKTKTTPPASSTQSLRSKARLRYYRDSLRETSTVSEMRVTELERSTLLARVLRPLGRNSPAARQHPSRAGERVREEDDGGSEEEEATDADTRRWSERAVDSPRRTGRLRSYWSARREIYAFLTYGRRRIRGGGVSGGRGGYGLR